MYSIKFYKDKNGNEPVKDYIAELKSKTDKHSRINYNKIYNYTNILSRYGTRAGKPYVKHIEGNIWELRPLKNRFLFFGCNGNEIIILSHFIKTTKKTPKSEIEIAKNRMNDYIERSQNNEQAISRSIERS